MSRTLLNFSAADPVALETSNYSYNFGPDLAVGETISSATWVLTAIIGLDTSPATRLIGTPTNSGQVTTQAIGNLVAGETYLVRATVVTSNAQTLTAYSNVSCVAVA